jgi:hypothetical protein
MQVRITVQHCIQQGVQQWQWQHRATPQNDPNAWFWPGKISANTASAIESMKLRILALLIFGSFYPWNLTPCVIGGTTGVPLSMAV